MMALVFVASMIGAQDAPTVPPKLIGEPPVVEVAAARRGVTGSVRVVLTIDVDGSVRDVAVDSGTGTGWDDAVVRAVEALRFEPATRDGTPLAVRIRWTVTFGRPPSWMGRARRSLSSLPTVGAAALRGQLLERGTRTPLAGIPVLLPQLGQQAVTDADGRFSFETLPNRALRLEVPALDHEAATLTVEPSAEELIIRLQPLASARYRSTVRGGGSDASEITVSVQRAREIPGSAGDPVKVVEVLPGVARPPAAGPNAGQIAVRGSAPEDTRFYLDGLPLFQLFHFGSIYSVVQDEWIRDITFRPGGFGAEYGEATGGLLNVNLADIPNDGLHGHLDINVYHAAIMLTGPLSESWTFGGAFRRAYIDAILGGIFSGDDGFQFTAAPAYYDYQFRADYKPSSRLHLRILALGSRDKLELVTDSPSDADPNNQGFALRRFFHQIQAALDWRPTDAISVYAGLATSYQGLNITPGRNTELQLTFDPITLRSDVTWAIDDHWQLRGGFWGTVTRYRVESNLPSPTKEGQIATPLAAQETVSNDERGIGWEGALWAEGTWRPLTSFSATLGMRGSHWAGTFSDGSFDPRLTLRYSPLDDGTNRVTLIGSAGLYHQDPSPDEWSESNGTPDLDLERSVQTSLGVQYRYEDWLSVELTGFYKYLDSLVTPGDPTGGPVYTNEGRGYAFGGELLLRINSFWVDGWVSYTLSRSRRTDGEGGEERPFSFDQTHVLALVLGVNLTNGWRIGSRFRYSTGNPFTPLAASYFDAGADVYVPTAAGGSLSQRVDDFMSLDVRLDKTWTFDSWRLITYIEVSNVTNRANVEQVGYNYDYSERQDITSLPIIPSFGIRGAF